MQDYKPTPYLIKHVDLVFQLNEDVTHVRSRLSMVPNYDSGASPPSLVLDGAAVAGMPCSCAAEAVAQVSVISCPLLQAGEM